MTETIEERADQTGQTEVIWDTASMQTIFANVVNVQSTQEQLDLYFGVNKSGGPAATPGQLSIELLSRIMMSPLAAKRLHIALGSVLKEFEDRYGSLGDPSDS